jgi:hypothetical protein
MNTVIVRAYYTMLAILLQIQIITLYFQELQVALLKAVPFYSDYVPLHPCWMDCKCNILKEHLYRSCLLSHPLLAITSRHRLHFCVVFLGSVTSTGEPMALGTVYLYHYITCVLRLTYCN